MPAGRLGQKSVTRFGDIPWRWWPMVGAHCGSCCGTTVPLSPTAGRVGGGGPRRGTEKNRGSWSAMIFGGALPDHEQTACEEKRTLSANTAS